MRTKLPAGDWEEKTMRLVTTKLGLLALLLCVGLMVINPPTASAQLNGNNIKGDIGLSAGSQAPPGVYYGLALMQYRTDRINDLNGTKVNRSGDLLVGGGAPLLIFTSKKKFLGGNYGATVVLPFLNIGFDAPRFGQQTGVGLADMYIQPVSLGWHLKQADFNTAYGIFIPTGRYTAGANDNIGLGMWGHELSAGTTVYFDKAKVWQVATSAALEFHTQKRDSVEKVGNLLTLEGGAGRSFLKGAAKAGLVYYSQWKLTDDTLSPPLTLLVRGKNSVTGLGPELTIPLASKSKLYGFVTVRYEWEVYARTTTQGNAFLLSLVFPLKPIKLK
jgi:hypothetical protein